MWAKQESMANRKRGMVFTAAEAAIPMKLATTIDNDSEWLLQVKLVQAYEDGTTLEQEVPHDTMDQRRNYYSTP